jgi:hypothetical protein
LLDNIFVIINTTSFYEFCKVVKMVIIHRKIQPFLHILEPYMRIWQKNVFKFFFLTMEMSNMVLFLNFLFFIMFFGGILLVNLAIIPHKVIMIVLMEVSKFYVESHLQGHVTFSSGQAFWRH